MTNETLQYVEAVTGREFREPEWMPPFFLPVSPDMTIDLDRDLFGLKSGLIDFDAFLLDLPNNDWMTEFGNWLDREYAPEFAAPCIDVAY